MKAYYRIDNHDIWNMDETGVHITESSRFRRVWLAGSTANAPHIPVPAAGKLVTAMEAVNPFRSSTPPMFISKGSIVPETHLPPIEIVRRMPFFLARTENAFATHETGVTWLKQAFIPFSKPRGYYRWRMLILNGHCSYTSDKFIQMAYANRVALLFLPGHATAVLQPLDLSVFGNIKYFFHEEISRRAISAEIRISMQDFFSAYIAARTKAITPRICAAAFRIAGILPTNPSIPLSRLSIDDRQTEEQGQQNQQAIAPARELPSQSLDGQVREALQANRRGECSRDMACRLRGILRGVQEQSADLALCIEEGERSRILAANATQSRLSTRAVRPLSPNRKVVNQRDAARVLGLCLSDPVEPPSPVRNLSDYLDVLPYEAPGWLG